MLQLCVAAFVDENRCGGGAGLDASAPETIKRQLSKACPVCQPVMAA